jgi:hypothetical protein
MNTILLILFVAFWVLFSVYEARKKKQEMLNKRSTLEEVVDANADTLSDESVGSQLKSTGLEYKPLSEDSLETIINEIDHDYSNKLENIGKVQVEDIKDEKFVKKFDLRNAVIYSELLNRKYF